jgi:hypothetical protein
MPWPACCHGYVIDVTHVGDIDACSARAVGHSLIASGRLHGPCTSGWVRVGLVAVPHCAVSCKAACSNCITRCLQACLQPTRMLRLRRDELIHRAFATGRRCPCVRLPYRPQPHASSRTSAFSTLIRAHPLRIRAAFSAWKARLPRRAHVRLLPSRSTQRDTCIDSRGIREASVPLRLGPSPL